MDIQSTTTERTNTMNDEREVTTATTTTDDEDRCPDCGSTEAGNCFYCKMD